MLNLQKCQKKKFPFTDTYGFSDYYECERVNQNSVDRESIIKELRQKVQYLLLKCSSETDALVQSHVNKLNNVKGKVENQLDLAVDTIQKMQQDLQSKKISYQDFIQKNDALINAVENLSNVFEGISSTTPQKSSPATLQQEPSVTYNTEYFEEKQKTQQEKRISPFVSSSGSLQNIQQVKKEESPYSVEFKIRENTNQELKEILKQENDKVLMKTRIQNLLSNHLKITENAIMKYRKQSPQFSTICQQILFQNKKFKEELEREAFQDNPDESKIVLILEKFKKCLGDNEEDALASLFV